MRKILDWIKKNSDTLTPIVRSIRLGGVVMTYTGLVFTIGAFTQYQRTAIENYREFNLKLGELTEEELNSQTKTVNLDKIYLAFVPQPNENTVVYKVHKTNTNSHPIVRDIGHIYGEKRKFRIDKLWQDFRKETLSSFSLIESAHAQPTPSFEWYGYENNYDFYEVYVTQDTVRRYYDDGAVLEYRIGENGYSISDSFRWIVRPS